MNINEAKKAFSKYKFYEFTIQEDLTKWIIQYGEKDTCRDPDDETPSPDYIESNYKIKYYDTISAAISDIRKIVKAADNANFKAIVYIERNPICIEHEELMSGKRFPNNIAD